MPFSEVAPGVLVRTSRRMLTTSTLLLDGDRGLLVDPSWEPDELVAIADELDERGVTVTAGFSTHPHHDHLLWHPRFGDAPRWASAAAVRAVEEHSRELRAALGEGCPDEVLATFAQVQALAGDTVPEPFGRNGSEERLEVLVHDGHAPGHAALWAPERGLIVVGDLLSDVELPLPFWPDDLPAYVAGLDLLAPYVGRATVLVPGHGHPSARPLERLDADRRYLDDVLSGRVPDDPRLGDPAMREHYEHLVRLVAGEADPAWEPVSD